jgi:hypothetical protein
MGACARHGDGWARRCWACRYWRDGARGRRVRRRRTPAHRAAGPPTAPAINQRTTVRAARSSCNAALRVASAAANRAGADRDYPAAAPPWSRSDAARAASARWRRIPGRAGAARGIPTRGASARAISESFSSSDPVNRRARPDPRAAPAGPANAILFGCGGPDMVPSLRDAAPELRRASLPPADPLGSEKSSCAPTGCPAMLAEDARATSSTLFFAGAPIAGRVRQVVAALTRAAACRLAA